MPPVLELETGRVDVPEDAPLLPEFVAVAVVEAEVEVAVGLPVVAPPVVSALPESNSKPAVTVIGRT
jgi:hypothetical protein